ncbi:MAG: hypothetical protein FWD93_06595, partial [Coriobacteriia bacterium]|nr:hypothetical protein [Coriobacteriia bacterium]
MQRYRSGAGVPFKGQTFRLAASFRQNCVQIRYLWYAMRSCYSYVFVMVLCKHAGTIERAIRK